MNDVYDGITPEDIMRSEQETNEAKPMTRDQIRQCFDLMNYDVLTDAQHTLVISFEDQFNRDGKLSERQCEVLDEIFRRSMAQEIPFWEK
jgi:hypothetical protein